MMTEATFCSRVDLASGQPAAGTGVHAEAYVFLPVPKRLWGAREVNAGWASPDDRGVLAEARRGGALARLYNPPRDAADAAPILVHKAEGRPPPPGLELLLSAFGHRWPAEAAARPRLAICTQGTRDRCCAKWGFAAYNAALALFRSGASPFEPLECSHLGGDRFAATGVFFPSGSMYAHLDQVDLAALIAEETAGRIVPDVYRGRVFEPPLVQVARAGLARDGLFNDAVAPLQLRREAPDANEATVGADGGRLRFRVTFASVPVKFYGSCAKLEARQPSSGHRTVYASGEPIEPHLAA